MGIAKDGSFSFVIGHEELSKGLRPTKQSPRNTHWLEESQGAVGKDGALYVITDLEELRIDTSVITDGFPYPQIFRLINLVLVCGETDIYEVNLVTGALVHRLNVTAGITWSVVDFHDFVYMSNGKVAVIRNATDDTWEVTADLPVASAMLNFNGQVLIGAPDVERT